MYRSRVHRSLMACLHYQEYPNRRLRLGQGPRQTPLPPRYCRSRRRSWMIHHRHQSCI
jgi:hypothetical protein